MNGRLKILIFLGVLLVFGSAMAVNNCGKEAAEVANLDEKISVILLFDKKPTGYREFIKLAGGNITRDYNIINGVALNIPRKYLEKLRKLRNLIRIYEDRKMHAFLSESIPQINADDIWLRGLNGSEVKVCVVDTGIDYNHYVLEGKIISQKCYCARIIGQGGRQACCPNGQAEDTNAMDDNGHGTHVAGIIASDNNTYKGVSYGVKLMAVKVLDKDGSGLESDVIKGIEWCNQNGADVISISLGGGAFSSTCDDEADAIAVNNAAENGSVVVIASGNDGYVDKISAPACASKAIAVGSLDKNNARASYSNGGSELDIVAPGGVWGSATSPPYTEIVSCFSPNVAGDSKLCFLESGGVCYDDDYSVNSDFIRASGTSMSAPHVSGAAALILQAFPELAPLQVKSFLENSADDLGESGWDNLYGWGKVNSLKAFNPVANIKICSDFLCSKGTSFFDINDTVYIQASVTDYASRNTTDANVYAEFYNNGLESNITLNHIGGNSSLYKGNFSPSSSGIYTVNVTVSNEYNSIAKSNNFHSYQDDVSSYDWDWNNDNFNEIVLENKHLVAVFDKKAAKSPILYLKQKDENFSYSFLSSSYENATNMCGISSDGIPVFLNFTLSSKGENLDNAFINFNAFTTGEDIYNPELNYTSKICSSACEGYSPDNVFDDCPASISNPNDGYEIINNIIINGTVFAPGDFINVTIDYKCYVDADAPDNIAVSYNDGSGWVNKDCWECPATGNYVKSMVFKLNTNPGTHYVRASIEYGRGQEGCPYTCADNYPDNDDLSFTIAEETLGDISMLADINITIRTKDVDYLVYNVTKFNESVFPDSFFSDITGRMGLSVEDDYYHIDNGIDSLVTSADSNKWTNYNSQYISLYDNSTNNVLGWTNFCNTSNLFKDVGVWNETGKEGLRIRYNTTGVANSDAISYLLAFTKGDWNTIEQWIPNIIDGQLPSPNFMTPPSGKFISMTLIGYPINFGDNNPGSSNISALGNDLSQYKISIGSETNVNVDIYQKADDYKTIDNHVLGIGNMTWLDANNYANSKEMSKEYDIIETNVTSETNISIYYWINIPQAKRAGEYDTKIYIKSIETGTSP